MDKKKVLVKIHPEGKYIVDIDPKLNMDDLKPSTRVALKSDSYVLHKILPNKVDPLVSLMMVEKVPDSTYEMIGGLEKQIKEIKEGNPVRFALCSRILFSYRAASETSRTFRSSRYCPAKGSFAIWTTRNW